MLYIYLDTSFLSQLTKVTGNSTKIFAHNEKWANLLNLLRQGIKKGILLCPASQFQTEEAMLSKDLLKGFISLQLELSKGYYLKEYLDILVHQFANQVLMYLGRPNDINLGWQAFTKTPPSVRDPLITAKTKSNMTQYAELVKPLREKFGYRLKYNGHYKAEKIAFLKQTFLNPNSDLPERLIFEAKVREAEVLRLYSFLNPDYVDSVPFVNIFCSLWASIIFHEKTRKSSEGDLYDVIALACAIPYCQVVTTDKNMKSFIKRLRINKKYEINVYAPIEDDLTALEKFLSKLVNI